MLRVENLTTKINQKIIIEEISFEVEKAQVLVIMGPSGSGKTTLLESILGVRRADSGEISIDDKDINALQIEDRCIGYLPQNYGLFPHLNVLENVCYGLKIRGVKTEEYTQKSKQIIKKVGLSDLEKRRIDQLSGGQRQRVALARALATEPKLLLLDEPLASIDTITKGEVAIELKTIFKSLNIPIIFVTHSPEEAFYFGDMIAILIDGKIVQLAKPSQVKNNPANKTVSRIIEPFSKIKE